MTKVLSLAPSPLTNTKIHVSHTSIPDSYLDPSHPPTQRVPFRQLQQVKFIKSVRLCLPTHLYNALYTTSTDAKPSNLPTTTFSKVIMTLHDILQDSSFRTGNFMMLAQPHPSSSVASSMLSSNSTVMYLDKGVLTIEMPYDVSQSSGLGAAFRITQLAGGGRKYEKSSARYRVVVNLREPNMVKGRPAFDRLMWASREVESLREGRTWLVTDSESAWYKERRMRRKRKRADDEKVSTNESSGNSTEDLLIAEPAYLKHVKKHHPTTVGLEAGVTNAPAVLVPTIVRGSSYLASLQTRASLKSFKGSLPDVLEEDIHDLIEYLDLLFLKSTRISYHGYGKVDPYLCRYTLPAVPQNTVQRNNLQAQPEDPAQASDGNELNDADIAEHLTLVEYSGLLPPDFALQLAVDLLRRSRSEPTTQTPGQGPTWAALQVKAHPLEVQGGTDGYTILLQEDSSPEKRAAPSEEQDPSAQAMEIDAEEGKPKVLNSRRLKFATCFEFVDSIVQ